MLDQLPLDVLLAMQEAVADPTVEGAERARLRAQDAGYYIHCERTLQESDPTEPIPMEEAPDGVESLTLRFNHE